MKAKRILRIITLATLIPIVSGIYSCKEDDFPVPEASSQAKFTYTVELNDDSHFVVQFIDESINATSYLWDFGNGNTSTEQNPVEVYTEQGNYDVTLEIESDKDLYYNKLVHTETLRLLLKETIMIETFDGEGPNTEDTWLPEGWLAIDADGDGLNWYWAERQGNGQMRSQSWDGDPLDVDNWLITAEIDLTEIDPSLELGLSFYVCPTANTEAYRKENYGVFISTSGTDVSDFTDMIWQETLTEDMENWIYQFRELDITDYIGEKIRIAFRHFDSSDNDRIVIDDVEVYKKF